MLSYNKDINYIGYNGGKIYNNHNNKTMKSLRKMRVEAGFAQHEVSKKLSVSVKTISMWEKCLAMPSLIDAVQLALLYRVSIEEIIQACGIPMRGVKVKAD